MELREIRCFLAVAELLSFRAAATRLGLRQPSVSQRIHALENELGVTLFERHAGRGVRLTNAGSRFLRDARRVAADADRALQNARRAGRGEIGEFVLGFVTTVAYPPLHDALTVYRASSPDIDITLVEGNTVDLATAVLDHRVDLAIVAEEVSSSRIHSVPLWHERLYVAVPGQHALARVESIDWAMLAGESLLVRASETASPGYDFLLRHFPAGGPAEIQRHLVGRDNLVALAAAGFGIAVTVEPLPCINHPDVILRQLMDDSAVLAIRAISLIDSENPAVGRFLNLLREQATRAAQSGDPARAPRSSRRSGQ